MTGSINQCTVEAATSPAVKDMLCRLDVHDVESTPWVEMFELGARAQVMKRGVFFPARATKLYEIWRRHDSFDAIDPGTRQQIQEKFLGRSFEEAYTEARRDLLDVAPEEVARIDSNPKHKLALVFRSYFKRAFALARSGDQSRRVDYLVYCGSAMGAFNQWVKGTELEPWQQRHVDTIAHRLLDRAAHFLGERSAVLSGEKTP